MNQRSILLIADPAIPVPPITYGGVERIVDLLAVGLVEKGWNVTLVGHPESDCGTALLPHSSLRGDRNGRLKNACNILKHVTLNKYDLIHSSAHYDLMAPLWPLSQNLIQTFHAVPDWNTFNKRVRLIPKRNLWFTTVGHHMVDTFSSIAPTRGIHNAINLDEFTFQKFVSKEAPLVFLGRIEHIKGTHTAIHIAKATNRKLVIAGNRSDDPEIDRYFKEEVEPHLSDQITYIGPVDTKQKNQLLGNAAALLMPIEWDEPFGLVVTEAQACGTPVIGYSRGALPEIIVEGITGTCCHSFDELVDAVGRIGVFSRKRCREEIEEKFSSATMVGHYESLYQNILSRNAIGRRK